MKSFLLLVLVIGILGLGAATYVQASECEGETNIKPKEMAIRRSGGVYET